MFKRAVVFFSISLSILAVDQVTKSYVVSGVPLNQSFVIVPDYLDIVHVRNSGAAFGFFSGAEGSMKRWALTVVSLLALVVIIGMTFWIEGLNLLTLVALALFFGGAAGNLADRVFHGEVIDFIDVHVGAIHWPAFNVADSSLCIGAALFFLYILRHKDEQA